MSQARILQEDSIGASNMAAAQDGTEMDKLGEQE